MHVQKGFDRASSFVEATVGGIITHSVEGQLMVQLIASEVAHSSNIESSTTS